MNSLEQKIIQDPSDKFNNLTEEDLEQVNLQNQKSSRIKQKQTIDNFNESITRKAVIRYITLVIDLSSGSLNLDMAPNRGVVIKNLLSKFVSEFAEQNPLSKLAVIVTYKEQATLLSGFDDSPQHHIARINQFSTQDGYPSLQNSLQVVLDIFQNGVPQYGRKEVLVIFSSLTNCDPADILETFAKLKQKQIQASVISLSAEIFVLENMCQRAWPGGNFSLAKDSQHFEEILNRFLVPTAEDQKLTHSIQKVEETLAGLTNYESEVQISEPRQNLIKIGFPVRITSKCPTTCVCHGKLKQSYYRCAQCLSPNCDLGVPCQVCGILLISSTKLGRTQNQRQDKNKNPLYLHVKDFIYEQKDQNEAKTREKVEILKNQNQNQTVSQILQIDGPNTSLKCQGCDLAVLHADIGYQKLSESQATVCTGCHNIYCLDCDIFIHQTLLQCPTCN